MSDSQYWILPHRNEVLKSALGRMRGLYRVLHAVSFALQLFLDNRPVHGQAFLVQVLKAIHQVVIDEGFWDVAQMLISYNDPLGIHACRKAVKELRAKGSGVASLPYHLDGLGGASVKDPAVAAAKKNAKERKRKAWV